MSQRIGRLPVHLPAPVTFNLSQLGRVESANCGLFPWSARHKMRLGGHLRHAAQMKHPAKLLVVDDNPVVLLSVSEFLRSAGFEVIEAQDAGEGLRQAREHLPDLVLLDVVLPDESGVELCKRLKADSQLKSLFVVLLSSSETSAGSKVSGLEAGADGYIARPIENRELLARVHSLLRIQQAEAALRRAQEELEQRVEERTAELARANAALRTMSLRLVEVQEAERRSLARELHDELGQVLTGLRMVVDQTVPVADEPVRARLNDALELINHLTQQLRNLSLALRPPMLDDLGLLIALDWHFKRYTQQTSVRVDFRRTPVPQRLPALVETAIYRIVQEALTNVARHAHVPEVIVRFWVNDERAGVQVEDGGAGFDVELALTARASTGLAGMRERAELLGGEFTLESKPGQGTRVTVELPLAVGAQGTSPVQEDKP
jgi:signal transduction histidine kinase